MDPKLYNSEWKAVNCGDPDCWCRMVASVDYLENQSYIDLKTTDANESHILIGAGCINQNIAEYIVKLHNDALKIRLQNQAIGRSIRHNTGNLKLTDVIKTKDQADDFMNQLNYLIYKKSTDEKI